MERYSNRKFRLGFYCKITDKNGKRVSTARARVKARIINYIEASSLGEGQILVQVKYGEDMFNSSTHRTKAAAKRALNAYTEKPLLDFIGGK